MLEVCRVYTLPALLGGANIFKVLSIKAEQWRGIPCKACDEGAVDGLRSPRQLRVANREHDALDHVGQVLLPVGIGDDHLVEDAPACRVDLRSSCVLHPQHLFELVGLEGTPRAPATTDAPVAAMAAPVGQPLGP